MSDSDYEPQPFLCSKCDSVLGWIVRMNGMTVLQVLRVPDAFPIMPRPETDTEQATTWSTLNLKEGDVPCCHCGSVEGWYANKHVLKSMLQRAGHQLEEIARSE